jgi:two-component system cell cycle sensor histidine kinase/response regulator CckA
MSSEKTRPRRVGRPALTEAQLRAILDAALDAVITMGADGLVTSWNPQAEAMFGWSAAEAVGAELAELVIPAELREAHRRGLRAFLSTGQGPILRRRLEIQALHRDGHEFPVELTVTPLKLNGTWRFSAFIRDLTEPKAAERRLAAQHAVTRILAESQSLESAAPTILRTLCETLGWDFGVLWVIDRETDQLRPVDLWHQTSIEVPEFEAQTRSSRFPPGIGLPGRIWATGRPAWIPDVVHDTNFPRARVAALGGLHAAFGFPITVGAEIVGVVEYFSRTIRQPDNALLDMVASVGSQLGQFIERRRAEHQLRTKAAEYRLLFDANPAPMWVFDAETLRFLAVNDAALRQYGYSREEFLSLTLLEIRPEEDREDLLRIRREEPTGPRQYSGLRHRKKDGTIIEVDVSADSLVFAGRPARIVLVQDVTQRTRLEEQLRQAQKMEAVGRLAGGIAHDFNNLLTVIGGHSELLLQELAAEDPRRADVLTVQEAGERAAELTRQLLAFSRKQVLEPQVLDLNSLLRDSERLLRRLLTENVELRIVLVPELGRVRADPVQLRQVVLNLVVNARDAMPDGGVLTLETQNADIDAEYMARHGLVSEGRYVLLAVSDTGIGMNAETKGRIFEPFFTTKERGRGTGLGLATVYGIVRQSGGFIWVYSEPGRGATFKVYLPAVDAEVTAESDRPVGESPRGSETVVLVEDDKQVRELAQRVLERQGYRVLPAADATEALRLPQLDAGPIHLLVTDVIMPGMNGRELAERLGVRYPDLKVLYVSGYTDDVIVRHGMLDPGTRFLQKPFSPDALVRKVSDVLGR